MNNKVKIVTDYGKGLKGFRNISEAENYFFPYKDALLQKLEELTIENPYFVPDYTVESLKGIEKWYFSLYENSEFHKVGFTQDEFERAMAAYFGEVVVKTIDGAEWCVTEYPFVPGKYEFMVSRELFSMAMENPFRDLYKRPDNKRRSLMFREYKKYFAR